MTQPGDVIETKAGECDEVIGPEGNRIKLGLLPPDAMSPPQLFSRMVARMGLLTLEQIKGVVTSETRTPAREIWGPSYVKDQDGRGACQGYASAACVEKIRDLGGQDFIPLSGDFAYSLVNGGRDQGSQLINGFKAAIDYGYCPEDTPGLVRWEYRKSRMPQQTFEAAKRFRGFEGFVCENEQEFASALAHGCIGVVAVHVAGNYSRLDANGVSRGGNGVGNHAVCVDDVVWDARLGKLKYDSPNSWKTNWGDNGRCYYLFDQHFQRTIKTHKFYVFPAASVDPEGNNPPPLRIV